MSRPDRPTALVTGASSGLGRAIAHRLSAEGWRVFGTSRRPSGNGETFEMLRLDVRDAASVRACVAEVLERTGAVDALVNNAGVMHLGLAEETHLDDARAVFETNFFGVVRVTNALLPSMRARRHGRIVHVGSLAAWVGEPGEGFYAASKQALVGWSESLRHEVWPFGLRVSLVEPGAFRTRVLASASTNTDLIADYDEVRAAARRTLEASLERGGDPERVAAVVLRVLRARSPRLRYGAGPEALWLPWLRRFLPQRLFDALVRRGYGLHRIHPPGG